MRVVEYGCTDNSKLDTKDQKSFLTSLFEIALFMVNLYRNKHVV